MQTRGRLTRALASVGWTAIGRRTTAAMFGLPDTGPDCRTAATRLLRAMNSLATTGATNGRVMVGVLTGIGTEIGTGTEIATATATEETHKTTAAATVTDLEA